MGRPRYLTGRDGQSSKRYPYAGTDPRWGTGRTAVPIHRWHLSSTSSLGQCRGVPTWYTQYFAVGGGVGSYAWRMEPVLSSLLSGDTSRMAAVRLALVYR